MALVQPTLTDITLSSLLPFDAHGAHARLRRGPKCPIHPRSHLPDLPLMHKLAPASRPLQILQDGWPGHSPNPTCARRDRHLPPCPPEQNYGLVRRQQLCQPGQSFGLEALPTPWRAIQTRYPLKNQVLLATRALSLLCPPLPHGSRSPPAPFPFHRKQSLP